RRGVAPGRTDEVDRAAERVAAVAQRIGPAEDFDVAKGGRIDLEEIEEPVRRVDGDTVHAEVDAPVAVVSRQAGAPDREPRVRAPARLRHHAGRPAEHVPDGLRRAVAVGGIRYDLDAARRALGL